MATISVTPNPPELADSLGIMLGPGENCNGLDVKALAATGFGGEIGAALIVPSAEEVPSVAVGIGERDELDAAGIRNAAAAYATAVRHQERLALRLPELSADFAESAGQAAVEGVLLARYHFNDLRTAHDDRAVSALALIVPADRVEAVERGARRGQICARAASLARDLANTPHNYLSARQFAEIAQRVGDEHGFGVAICDENAVRELRLGGLLAVNAGSAEPPRMIELTYTPPGESSGRLVLVGKGIMFDSGGLSLKPSDASHAQMKNDMSGAAAILATFSTLRELGCTSTVTGYLMCTDNMPSATATVLGDVYTARNGKTVEVIDTDAEGRLVMSDALTLAVEDASVDAVIDIATLTGSVMRALGSEVAGLFGNHARLVEFVKSAAVSVDEPVWELPLRRSYRRQLRSTVADIANVAPLGSPDGIIAALFLADFVGDRPWAHLDIAGVATNSAAHGWYPEGCTGFGTRLLIEVTTHFDRELCR